METPPPKTRKENVTPQDTSPKKDAGTGGKPPASPARQVPPLGILLLGAYLIGLALVLAYALFALWPEQAAGAPSTRFSLFWGLISGTMSYDQRLILLVLLAGALGSYLHAATSFADYVGNQYLMKSWVWWYVLRPFIGMALALTFYFVLRGGFLSAGADTTDVSMYGIVALSILAGMFSKQATDKLSELFSTLFQTRQKVERADSMEKKETTTATAKTDGQSAAGGTTAPEEEGEV